MLFHIPIDFCHAEMPLHYVNDSCLHASVKKNFAIYSEIARVCINVQVAEPRALFDNWYMNAYHN
jgi:hypothetical protein